MPEKIVRFMPIIVFSYAGQVLMKRGVSSLGPLEWSTLVRDPVRVFELVFLNTSVILGFLAAGIGAVFYLFALSKTDLTVALPILGALGFIALPFIGKFILHEGVTPARVIGTVVIAAGMLVVARS
jgi:multidrug transporter EmrE-like cation transporter